jgi:predicted DNA-binding protein (UPF0251 family)
MKIIKAKYIEETLNWVSIEFEDGTKGQSSLTDGIRRQYTDVLDEYIADGGIVEEVYTTEELEAIELAKLLEIKAKEKAKIQDIINKSTVTTAAGNVFDANLESRINMADAILASDTLGQTETVWRLADNSEITVDITELREAHALALQSYAQIKAIGTSK